MKTIGKLISILGKNRLIELGFDVHSGKISPQQSVILNKAEEDMPSASDITKADDREIQEITENVKKSMEDLIAQFKEQETLPMRERLGLDKQLRSIRGSLKVERFSWKNTSGKKSTSLRNFENIPENMTVKCEKTS